MRSLHLLKRLRWVAGASWLLLIILLGVGPIWAKVRAQEGTFQIVIPAEKNLVLHSADELAAVLRKHGMDEDTIQRILELERRIEQAHAQGMSYDKFRRHMEQWIQELFPRPSSPDTDASSQASPRPLAWFVDYAGIYACCTHPAVEPTGACRDTVGSRPGFAPLQGTTTTPARIALMRGVPLPTSHGASTTGIIMP